MRHAVAAIVGCELIASLLFAGSAVAQDPRYERLDPDTRARVSVMIDSARMAGLPTEPLIQRALEGALKGASGDRIVAAVRRLATDLGVARSAIGTHASAAELEAGAAALRAGATPAVLTQLRQRRSARQSLTVALAVLADLAARGVPVDSAAAAVLVLAPTARDADLVEFRRAVERDIALGAPPAAATSVRLDATARAAAPGRP